jgi:hypothetical protein
LDDDGPLEIVDHKTNGPLFSAIMSQANGAAPGPSGWTGDMLKVLAYDQQCLQYLAVLVQDIHKGALPSEAKPYILASESPPPSSPSSRMTRATSAPSPVAKLYIE